MRARAWLRAAVLSCAIAALAWQAPPAGAQPVYTLLYDGASPGAARFVDDLTHLWQGSNPDLGSVLAGQALTPAHARLQALRRWQGTFAIVDADTLARSRADYPDLAAVTVLWPEALHLLARGNASGVLGAMPAGDLIVTDSARYGQAALAGASGAPSPATHWLLLTQGSLADALARQPLPLLLASGMPPLPDVARALQAGSDVRLLSLARPFSQQIRGQYPWLSTLVLLANTYPGQSQPVETLGVRQVLVTRADAPDNVVQHALAALFRWDDRMAAVSARFAAIDRKTNSAAIAWFPYHAAAMKVLGITPPAQ